MTTFATDMVHFRIPKVIMWAGLQCHDVYTEFRKSVNCYL